MLEQVENKIQELQNLQKEEYYKKKDQDLLEWGLTSKKSDGKTVPIIVTDAEYEALIEASSGMKSAGRNKIASILNLASIMIFSLGIIVGGVMVAFSESLGAVYFTASVLAAAIIALIFRGISEAICLLQQLLDMKRAEDFKKMRPERKKSFPDKQPEATAQYTSAPPVHFAYPNQQGGYVYTANSVYQQPPKN